MSFLRSQFLKTSLLFILLVAIAYQLNFHEIIAHTKLINSSVFIITTLLMFVTILLGALRWWYVLLFLRVEISILRVLRLYFASLFTNIVLPGSIGGEALKIWQLHKSGVSYGKALNSILLDRAAVIIATVLMVLSFGTYFIATHKIFLIPSLGSILSSVLFLAIIMLFFSIFLYKKFKNGRVANFLNNLTTDSLQLLSNQRLSCCIIAISLLCNCIYSVIFYWLTVSLSWDISIYSCLIFVPIINIVCYLPISYAGWGVREIATIYGYSMLGLPKEVALIVSIVFGVQLVIGSLPGSLCILKLDSEKLPS